MTEKKKLAHAKSAVSRTYANTIVEPYPRIVGGFVDITKDKYNRRENYHEMILECRWFYENNPIAGTVIERMADLAITKVRNKRKSKYNVEAVDDTTLAYYDWVAEYIRPFLKQVALEYLIHGMAVPSYETDKTRGNLLVDKLGRKRYIFPTEIWIRNPENIILKKRPTGIDRQAYLKIPPEDVDFITSKGRRTDGTIDEEGYQILIQFFPEYVAAVQKGETIFPLEDSKPILRKTNSYRDYPTPFLRKALDSLRHKEHLKAMDRSLASRVIEALRHVKVGSDEFPAEEDDIEATRAILSEGQSTGELVRNIITNHTVDMEWVIPPLDALLNENKYIEANADIFMAMGFPRVLVTGETLRSNSSDSSIAALGPKSTLEDMRDGIMQWVYAFYMDLAEKNGFSRIPEPYFSPIVVSDYTALVQYAIQAVQTKAISRDTLAQLYGTDFTTESAQIEAEEEILPMVDPKIQGNGRDDTTVQNNRRVQQSPKNNKQT